MPKRILALEDDPQIAELIDLLLDSPDIQVSQHTSGKEGWEAIQQNPPDLVLLDVKLPEMTGWEVFDALRAHETLKELPVIMLSVSQPEYERRQHFSQSKVNFYMAKPFDLLKLRRLIRNILQMEAWYPGGDPQTEVVKTNDMKNAISEFLKVNPDKNVGG